MKAKSIVSTAILVLIAACSADQDSSQTSPAIENDAAVPAVSYVTTETFDEEVLNSDVPVLVDFTAVWCVPCKEVDPIIMSLYPEMYGRAKVFKLDIDDDPDLYQQLGVNGVPHILFFNKGQEIDRIISPQTRETYIQYLEALIDGRSTLDVSLTLLEEDQFKRHFIMTRSAEDLTKALEKVPGLMADPLENGETPLSMILNRPNYRQDEQIEFALASGATPSTRDLVGLGRCEEFVSALEDDPEAVNRPDPDGATPLYLAAARSYRLEGGGCLQQVIDARPDPNANLSQEFFLGRSVVLLNDPELITQIVDLGLDIEQRDVNGWSMLHWAANYGYVEVVQLLLDRRADAGASTRKVSKDSRKRRN